MLQAADSEEINQVSDGDVLEAAVEGELEIKTTTTKGNLTTWQKIQNNGCCKCVMASIFVYGINLISFGILVAIGSVLEQLEEDDQPQMRGDWSNKEDREAYYEAQDEAYRRMERRDLIKLILFSFFVTFINVLTIYFLCKRSETSQRHFKASLAVFGCCNKRTVYQEAIVPCGDVLRHIWRHCCQVTLRECCMRISFVVVVLLLFFAFMFAGTDREPQEHTLVFFLVISVILLGFLFKLASRGDFFLDKEALLDGGEDESNCKTDDERHSSVNIV